MSGKIPSEAVPVSHLQLRLLLFSHERKQHELSMNVPSLPLDFQTFGTKHELNKPLFISQCTRLRHSVTAPERGLQRVLLPTDQS